MMDVIRLEVIESADNAHSGETPMMKCGHAANATTKDGEGNSVPCCVICTGIDPGAMEIDGSPPSLEGRTARCPYRDCPSERPSSPDLAFFEMKSDKDHDVYYCGCRGWN